MEIETCRHFLLGKCRFGDKCRFSHTAVSVSKPDPLPPVEREITPIGPSSGKTLCKHFREGNCRFGNACKYSHDLSPSLQPLQQQQSTYSPPFRGLPNDLTLVRDSKTRVGIDIGGVIISSEKGQQDTSFFGANFLATPMVKDCTTVIRRIVDLIGSQNVFLISKAGQGTAKKTIEWMKNKRFLENSGIEESRILFCLNREDKGPLCRNNGITLFIDDNIENLGHARSVGVLNLIYFGFLHRQESGPAWFVKADSWARIEMLLFEK